MWLDVVDPTPDEEHAVEQELKIEVPTRAEMQELEASSRLYRENGAVYMTATMLIKTETMMPETSQVVFILTKKCLVTLRYAEPWSFKTFAQRAPKSGCLTAEMTFLALLDTTVERLADLLELVSLELDNLSRQIFSARAMRAQGPDLSRVILKIGTCGNIASKVRESLLDKGRLLTFAESATAEWCAEGRSRLRATLHDIQSLSDHASFTNGKISFLLDATLGLINIGLNGQMKTLSWVMVAVMWPTLVSGFFAMNVTLPFPGTDSHRLWPFALCVFLAFGPLLVGGSWYWWKFLRHAR